LQNLKRNQNKDSPQQADGILKGVRKLTLSRSKLAGIEPVLVVLTRS